MASNSNEISQQELAQRLGISTTALQKWEDKNFDDFVGPFPEGKMDGRTKLYSWKACLQWYVKYKAATDFKSLFVSDGDTNYVNQKIEGDARKSLANAQLAELELQKEQGKYIPASDIEDKITSMVLTLRGKISNISSRLSVLLSLDEDQKEAVERETRDILKELSSSKIIND